MKLSAPVGMLRKGNRFMQRHDRERGFTLIELTIVLVVASLLFVGLYRLLASGNQQVRDQSAANQQAQLIAGVKSFLASSQGQNQFLLALPTETATATGATALALPSVNSGGTCTVAASESTICSYLPAGFITTTTNAYGQTYLIMVERNDFSTNGNVPTSYSFMIITSGGQVIPDSSGGRIAAFIGNDGGFIYSSNICNTATGAATSNLSACGAYGAWAVNANTAYGFATTSLVGGQIATRTYVSPSADNTSPWLERNVTIPGDGSFVWNTMTTDLYMGSINATAANDSNIWLLPPNGSPVAGPNVAGSINLGRPGQTTAGGTINAAGGTINMQSATGTINMAAGTINSGGGTVNMQAGTIFMGAGTINMQNGPINLAEGIISGTGAPAGSQIDLSAVNQAANSILINLNDPDTVAANKVLLNATNNCTIDQTLNHTPANCKFSITTNNLQAAGTIAANGFYANAFVYNASAGASDIRLKKNVRPLEDPLDEVMRLKPVSFTFKASGRDSLGVIAQDVEKIYPQLVVDGPGGMKAVNYDGLIAPLIGAVQELKQENDDLRQKLKLEDERENKLEQKIKSRDGE